MAVRLKATKDEDARVRIPQIGDTLDISSGSASLQRFWNIILATARSVIGWSFTSEIVKHHPGYRKVCDRLVLHFRDCETLSWLPRGLWSAGPSLQRFWNTILATARSVIGWSFKCWRLQIQGSRWLIKMHWSRSMMLVILVVWMRSWLLSRPGHTSVSLREKHKTKYRRHNLAVNLKSQEIKNWSTKKVLHTVFFSSRVLNIKTTWPWETHHGHVLHRLSAAWSDHRIIIIIIFFLKARRNIGIREMKLLNANTPANTSKFIQEYLQIPPSSYRNTCQYL